MAKTTLAKIKQPWQTMGLFGVLLLVAYIPLAALVLAGNTPHVVLDGSRWGWALIVPALSIPLSLAVAAATVYLSKNQTVILSFTLLCNFFIPAHSALLALWMLSLGLQVYLFTKAFHPSPARIRELYLLGVSPQRIFMREAVPRIVRNLHWIYVCSLAPSLYIAMNWNQSLSLNGAKLLFTLLVPVALYYMGTLSTAHLRDPYTHSVPATSLLLILGFGTMVNLLYPMVNAFDVQQIGWSALLISIALAPLVALGVLAADASTLARKTLLLMAAMVVGIGDFTLYAGLWPLFSEPLAVRHICIASVGTFIMMAFVENSWKKVLGAMLLYAAILLSFDAQAKYLAVGLFFLLSWLKPQFNITGI